MWLVVWFCNWIGGSVMFCLHCCTVMDDGNRVALLLLQMIGWRNLRFRSTIQPERFILTLYCWYGRTSTILPLLSCQPLGWCFVLLIKTFIFISSGLSWWEEELYCILRMLLWSVVACSSFLREITQSICSCTVWDG